MNQIYRVLIYTLETAFFSTLIAFFIGIIAAYFTSHKKFFARKFILSLSSVPLCVPSLIIALGYVSFFGINGTFNSIFKTSFSFLYSTLGLVLAQGFYNFPFVTGIINDAWEQLPKETENAARMLGAKESRIFFTITLRQLGGAIGAACIPIFLFCFFSFMIVLLFSPVGKSTLEVEIYHSIRTTLQMKSALSLALVETITAVLIVIIYCFVIKKYQKFNDGNIYIERKKEPIKNCTQIIIFSFLMFFIFLFFLCPLCSIFISAFTQKVNNHKVFTLMNFKYLFSSVQFYRAIFNSFFTSVFTGFFCCCLGFLYGFFVRIYKKQGSILFAIIPFIPMAISSVIISWLFSLVFHNSSVFVLIFSQVCIYWPVAFRQIQNSLNKITLEIQNAALILSKNKIDMFFRVYLSSCKRTIISSFLYCFSISLGEATMPLVLSIKNFETISLYTYKFAEKYKFNYSCACGSLLILICIAINFFRKNDGYLQNKCI